MILASGLHRSPSATRTASLVVLAVLASVLILITPAVVAAADAPRVLGPGAIDEAPVIRVLSNRADGVDLEFELPALRVDDMPAQGEVFQGLSIPRGGENGEVGQPMLPVFGRLVQIPDRAGVRVEATAEQVDEYDGIKVLPVQADEGGFAYDAAAYSRDSYGDAPLAKTGGPALLRGVRVVPLTLAPVQYNPAQGRIRVARRIRLTVTFSGENTENVRRPDSRPIAPSFDQIDRELIVNYDNGGREVHPGSWLIICPDNNTVVNDLQPLVAWRQRMGLAATLVTTATTGTTTNSIKSYIQNAYDTWDPPLEYVVLAGDASGSYNIPTWHETLSGLNGEGDHPYTQLDGTDVLSDVHIGRLSFNATSELETIVAKIVGYESSPYLADDPQWFTRACVVGDPAHQEYSCPLVMQWAKERLLQIGYTRVDTVFSGNFVSQMTTYLNLGDTIFSYRGYLNMSGWSGGNVAAMTNGWKMPFAVISTCGTGSFQSETSISESFLRAGTPTLPKGAIAATGTATWGTHTRFNNCYVTGVLGSILYDNQFTVGAAHTRGKLELYLEYWSSSQANYVTIFSYWNNLMGDPATECWTGYPTGMTATYPGSLSVGTNAVTVSVSQLTTPVAGAQVCLWKGTETYAVGTTNTQGRVELPVSLATPGDLLLTVSKHNRQTVQAAIPVTSPTVYVGYQSSTVIDDGTPPSAGNGDGQVNPLETIALPVQLHNYGRQSATAVTAVLTSSDPYVSVRPDTLSYGNVASGTSVWGPAPFAFTIDPGCPHGHVIRLDLDTSAGASHWHSIIDIPVVSADLQYATIHWSNAGGNGLLDPGETVQVSIVLHNDGGLSAETPFASLASFSNKVDVPVSACTYPTILPGEDGENVLAPFTVHASSDCFNGYSAPMKLLLQFSSGIRDTVLLSLPVGVRSSTDPSGPDGYGYLAYDNTDVSYSDHPSYTWVELDPAYGGDGTEIVLGDYGDGQDKTTTVALPFSFQYYGTAYTTASVCSNGWMVMGHTYLSNYRNWTIPSLGGPNGVIAAFWDDLYQSSGTSKAFQKYDAANGRWIVEWSRFRNSNSSGYETFEVIFYDPSVHPTGTGDGMIEFQYSQVSNNDSVDGYATVGIEKPGNTDGLLYTYFNQYSPGSASLGSGSRSILFVPGRENLTGVAPADRAPAFALSAANPVGAGGSVTFTLDRTGPARLSIYDVGGREVRRLVDGPFTAGVHSVHWDGTDDGGRQVASGIYFYRLSSEGRALTRKAIVVRQR